MIPAPRTIFSDRTKAEAIAATNNASDPSWTYTVLPLFPSGWIVRITDEDGHFVEDL